MNLLQWIYCNDDSASARNISLHLVKFKLDFLSWGIKMLITATYQAPTLGTVSHGIIPRNKSYHILPLLKTVQWIHITLRGKFRLHATFHDPFLSELTSSTSPSLLYPFLCPSNMLNPFSLSVLRKMHVEYFFLPL